MAGWGRGAALLPMAGLLAGLAGGARAADPTEPPPGLAHPLPAWIAPGGTGAASPAVLLQPAGWQAGDAAVMLAPGGDWPPGLRGLLAEALVAAGAAVLDLAGPGAGGAPGVAEEAARMLGRDASAGLVVVIARGEGAAALAPASLPVAALVRLGPGAPGFVFGAAPPGQAWPERAALLCALLEPLGPEDTPGLGAGCRAALPR